jgi:hypothetical protein
MTLDPTMEAVVTAALDEETHGVEVVDRAAVSRGGSSWKGRHW